MLIITQLRRRCCHMPPLLSLMSIFRRDIMPRTATYSCHATLLIFFAFHVAIMLSPAVDKLMLRAAILFALIRFFSPCFRYAYAADFRLPLFSHAYALLPPFSLLISPLRRHAAMPRDAAVCCLRWFHAHISPCFHAFRRLFTDITLLPPFTLYALRH